MMTEDNTAALADASADILTATDLVGEARRLVECILMATEAMDRENGWPISTVAAIAVEKLLESREILNACIGAQEGGAA